MYALLSRSKLTLDLTATPAASYNCSYKRGTRISGSTAVRTALSRWGAGNSTAPNTELALHLRATVSTSPDGRSRVRLWLLCFRDGLPGSLFLVILKDNLVLYVPRPNTGIKQVMGSAA
jgi:hypothetical protein